MTISFKKYASFVAIEGEPTDEQINEIFGLFKNNQKVEKLKAEREKLKKDTAKKVATWREKKELEAQAKAQASLPKNMQRPAVSTAAGGRAAERDWLNNIATESIDEPNYEEVEWKMDKYMPEDEDLQYEYHQLMNANDREGLIDLFNNEADFETMKHYGGDNFTIEGFVDWLLENR